MADKQTPAEPHLVAHLQSDGWCVVDPHGGIWWPGEKAKAQIAGSDAPAETAIAWCRDQPTTGEWHC